MAGSMAARACLIVSWSFVTIKYALSSGDWDSSVIQIPQKLFMHRRSRYYGYNIWNNSAPTLPAMESEAKAGKPR